MKKYSLFFLLAFLFSCQKEKNEKIAVADETISTTLTNDEVKSLLRLKENHAVSLEDAQKEAIAVASFLDQSSDDLKKNVSRNIASVNTIWYKTPASNLKSNTVDSLALYVFNFSNNKQNDSLGYAIIAGDDRVSSVLACSNSGKLNATVSDPGLNIFLSRLPDYLNKKIEESSGNDSVYNKAIDKLNNAFSEKMKPSGTSLKSTSYPVYVIENYTVGSWEPNTQYGPFTNVNWGQGYPYNKSLDPIYCGGAYKQPWTGCMATAIAQIMAYYRYPSIIQGIKFEWDTMLTSSSAYYLSPSGITQVASLMKVIGTGIATKYACEGSSSEIDKANAWYNNIGYSSDGVQNYNLSTVVNSLAAKRPVLISGYSIKTTKTSGWWIFSSSSTYYSEGHAWVIDGYLKRQRKVNYNLVVYMGSQKLAVQPMSTYEYDEYVRCNYGWSGGSNGYYQSGVFTTNVGPVTLKSGTIGNYQYDVKILPNIRPR